jgi:hypothetical protein
MPPPVYRNIQKGAGSMNESRKRRLSIGTETARSLAVVAAGILVLVAGCIVAVYRDMEMDRETELGSQSRTALPVLMSSYGGTSGALSVDEMLSDPGRVADKEPFDGRVARIRIEIPNGKEITVLVPDEAAFGSHPRERENMHSEFVPVEISSGSVIPARIEVTLYG